MQLAIRAIWLPILAFVAACGGSDSGSVPEEQQKPGGIYVGHFTMTDPERVRQVEGVVFENGQGFFFSEDAMFRTAIDPYDDEIYAPLNAYTVYGSTWDGTDTMRIGAMSGDLVDRSEMSGTFSLTDEGSGTFDLTYQAAAYESAIASSTIVGTYTETDSSSGFTKSITLNDQRKITGQDSNGCNISGDFSIAASGYNAISLTNMTYTCADYVLEEGSGAAYLDPDATSPEGLVYGVRYRIRNGGPTNESVVTLMGRYTKN